MQQDMEYVLEVYQEGSFSRAARKLFLTQPTLSISIHKVEEKIGMPLFERGKQSLELTDAGEIYIKKAKEIRNIENELKSQIDDLAELNSGEIHIGGTQYFNSYVLPPVLSCFSARYPNISLQFTETSSDKLIEMLREGSIHLMFHCGEYDETVFTSQPVFQDYLLLTVPDKFPINRKFREKSLSYNMVVQKFYLSPNCPGVPLSEFSELPFLLLTQGNNLNERAFGLCKDAGFTPKIRMEIEQLVTAYRLSSYGLGGTFAPALLIRENPCSNMAYYKLNSPLTTRYFYAIVRKNSYIKSAISAFIHSFQEIWKNYNE